MRIKGRQKAGQALPSPTDDTCGLLRGGNLRRILAFVLAVAVGVQSFQKPFSVDPSSIPKTIDATKNVNDVEEIPSARNHSKHGPPSPSVEPMSPPVHKPSMVVPGNHSVAPPPIAIDWSDKIFKRVEWDNDPIVIESHKLLFFTIPKNSCSDFKMLFRRMMGFSDWKTVGSKEEKLHNPWKNGLKYLGSFPKQKQAEFMSSPEWTRAIFVRDPRERVLSAYMDKGLGSYKEYNYVQGGFFKHHCCGMKRSDDPEILRARLELKNRRCLPYLPFGKNNTLENFPFETFVRDFMSQCDDNHWKPQSRRMSATSWKAINFVGHLDRLMEDGHALLRRLGAFEEFGAEGWGPSNGPIFQRNTAKHATSAHDKMEEFYRPDNPEIETLVLQHYRADYEHPVMNFTKPERWDQLMGT